jgi:site-specific recombinase XerD
MMRQYNAKNERIKYRYFEKLRETNSKSKATVRAARNALYKYDQYFGFEDLETFDKDKAIAFKKFLLSTPSKKTGGTISESYVLHAVRYVADFFKWLGSLPTYRSKIRIHEIEYFNLSNEDKAIALATAPRDYATVEQITGVIKNMSFNTDVEKRNRALICLLLLTGARISGLITLKLKHLDLTSKSINQHPKDVKTKNRKRIKTYFFPVESFVGDILHDYVQFLIGKGFSKNDPIFPRIEKNGLPS